MVLRQGTSQLKIGALAVDAEEDLTAKVGKDFIGRGISVTGEPLDGKGAIAADAYLPGFQRIALLGDSKSGKTTLATQIAINQRSSDQVVVYVLVAKRRSDVDILLSR